MYGTGSNDWDVCCLSKFARMTLTSTNSSKFTTPLWIISVDEVWPSNFIGIPSWEEKSKTWMQLVNWTFDIETYTNIYKPLSGSDACYHWYSPVLSSLPWLFLSKIQHKMNVLEQRAGRLPNADYRARERCGEGCSDAVVKQLKQKTWVGWSPSLSGFVPSFRSPLFLVRTQRYNIEARTRKMEENMGIEKRAECVNNSYRNQ